MKDFLKKVIYIGLFSTPFIPLIVTKSFFFPFVTGKNFAFRIIIGVIVGAWLILILKNEKYRPKFSWILGSLISFIVLIGISNIFGMNPEKSFWSNFERMEGWVTLIHLFGYFLVLISMLNTEKIWNRFINTSVGVSVFVGFYGIFQLLGFIKINQGGVRVDATFGNATYLAVYMLFHVFITLFLLYKRNSEYINKKFFRDWVSIVYFLTLILQVVIIYYTATRGTIIGLIGGLVLTSIGILFLEKENKFIRKLSYSFLILLIVLSSLFFSLKNSDLVKESTTLSRLASISIEDASKSRIPVWNMAIEGFKEKPLLGWGQENFNYVFNKNYNPKMYAQEQWFDRAHNVFLDWLIAGGILGLVSYLALFLFSFYYLWKGDIFQIREKVILTGLLVSYFIHNVFVFDNIVSYIFFVLILGYIHYKYSHKKETKNNLKNIHNESLKNFFSILLVLITIFSLYLFNAKGMLSSYSLIEGMKQRATGNLDLSIESYKKALSYDTYSRREIREQLVSFASEIANANIDINTKQSFFDLARKEILKQIEEDPENTRYEVFAGTLYSRYRDYNNAVIHLERALELSPNKQSIMFELGSVYINKGEEKKALEVLKKAFEVEPEYQEARLIYGVASIYAKENELTEELFVPIWGTVFVPDDRVMKAYFDTGQKDKVIEVIENKIKINPGYEAEGRQIIEEIRAGRL